MNIEIDGAKCMASNDFAGAGRAMGCSASRAWEVWCAASAAVGLPPPPRPVDAAFEFGREFAAVFNNGPNLVAMRDFVPEATGEKISMADVAWTPAGLGSVQWHSVVGIARRPRTMLKGRWRR